MKTQLINKMSESTLKSCMSLLCILFDVEIL